MSVALSIAFTGLCALVADGNGRPADVLLVDARGIGPVDGMVLPAHAPTLVVSLSSLANAETSGPTRVVTGSSADGSGNTTIEELGLWDLTGSEVKVRIEGREGAGVELYRPSDPDSSWPEPPRDVNNAASWRDIRFVANMRTLAGDGRIVASRSTAADTGELLPRGIAARIHLDSGRLEAGIPTRAAFRSAVYEFRSAAGEPKLRQALTDTIRWNLETEASAVVIEIVPLAGGPAKRLVLKPSDTVHSVFVSNLPADSLEAAHHAISDEDMGALHFGAYYELLMHEPADRPLPRAWRGQDPRRAAGIRGTIFCPPAMFSRD